MMSQIPVKLEKIKKKNLDKEILRAGIMAELDAVNLYEQMAAMVQKEEIRTILLEIAREEKTHIGEFQSLLLKADAEQAEELLKGEQEVRKQTGP